MTENTRKVVDVGDVIPTLPNIEELEDELFLIRGFAERKMSFQQGKETDTAEVDIIPTLNGKVVKYYTTSSILVKQLRQMAPFLVDTDVKAKLVKIQSKNNYTYYMFQSPKAGS